MARFVKPGHKPVTTTAPRDRVNLIAQGYREEEETSTAKPAAAPAKRKPQAKTS